MVVFALTILNADLVLSQTLEIDGSSRLCISGSGYKTITAKYKSKGYKWAIDGCKWKCLTENSGIVDATDHGKNFEGIPNWQVPFVFSDPFPEYYYNYGARSDDSFGSIVTNILNNNLNIPEVTIKFILQSWESSRTFDLYLEANAVDLLSNAITGTKNVSARKTITVYRTLGTTSQTISIANSNPFCDQGTQVSASTNNNSTYNWTFEPSNAVNLGSNWNNNSAFNISSFNTTGNVKIKLDIVDQCGNSAKSETNISVGTKSVGPLVDNTGQSPITAIIPDQNGIYSLRFTNYISGANFTWRSPLSFGGNSFQSKTTNNSNHQFSDKMPSNAFLDYNGTVTKSGVCGTETFNYTVKALQTPTFPPVVNSCDKEVPIFFNNPTGLAVYNSWVQSGPSGAYTKNINYQQINLVAPQNGTYRVCFAIQNVTTNPCTNINVGKSPTTNVNTEWQGGVLSPVNKTAISNLSVSGNEGYEQVYFVDNQAKLWYYQFANGANAWVPYQINTGAFTPLISGVTYQTRTVATHPWQGVVYVNNRNKLTKAWQYGNAEQYEHGVLNAKGFITFANPNSGDGFLVTDLNKIAKFNLWGNQVFVENQSINAAFEELTWNNGFIYYVDNATKQIYRFNENNPNQFGLAVNSATIPTILTGTNIRFYQDKMYFVAANGRIVEASLTNNNWSYISTQSGSTPQTVFKSNFDINPSTGVIYATVSSTNRMRQVYVNPSTNLWTEKDLPANIGNSVKFYFKHVYFISAGNLVYNLYLNTTCVPSVFREENTEEVGNNVSMVSPNPFIDELRFSLGEVADYEAHFINNLGNVVEQVSFTGNTYSANTSQLASGVYIVQLFKNGQMYTTQKLIK